MGRKEGKLPLPQGFFQAPRLNSKETNYLINLAKQACKEVVYYSRRTGGPINWVPLSAQRSDVQMYQGIDETGDQMQSITYYRGTTRIYASIDEIADFFKQDSVEKIAGFAETVGKDLLDQHTLYDLALPTEENPKHYVGVKWTAVESPSKIARNRDFCYLECHDEFVDTIGKKRGWVRSLHSIRLPCCPPLRKSHGLVRGSLYRCGYVFIESENRDYVDAIHTVHLDIKGKSPSWIKLMAMTARTQNIAQINRYFLMQRLCRGRLLGDLELPTKRGVEYCEVCDHKFRVFRRKWRCRKCGKVTCTKCGTFHILDYAGTGARKVRICHLCCEGATLHHQRYYHSDREKDEQYAMEGRELLDWHSHRQLPPLPPSRHLAGRPSGIESRSYSHHSHSPGHSPSVRPRPFLDHGGKYRATTTQDAAILEAKRLQKEFEDSYSNVNRRHLQNGTKPRRNTPSPNSAYGRHSELKKKDYNKLNDDYVDASDDDDNDDDDEEDHHLDGPHLMFDPENSRRVHAMGQRESLDSIHMNSANAGTFVGNKSSLTNSSSVSNESPSNQDRPHVDLVQSLTPFYHCQESGLSSQDRKESPLTREDLSFGRGSSTGKQLEQLQRSYYEAKNKRSKDDQDGSDDQYMPRPSEILLPNDIEDSDEDIEYELDDHSYRPHVIQHEKMPRSRDNAKSARHSSKKSQKSSKREQLENTKQVDHEQGGQVDADKLAESLALAAMRLYEKQQGKSNQNVMQQSTRETALKKMIDMYTKELEESKKELALLKNKHKSSTRNRAATHDGARHLARGQSAPENTPMVANLSELSASTFQKLQQRANSDNGVMKKHLEQAKHASDSCKKVQEYKQLEQPPPYSGSQRHYYHFALLNHTGSDEQIDAIQGKEENQQHQLYDLEQKEEQVPRPSSLMMNAGKTSSMEEEGRPSSLTLSTHGVTYQQMEGKSSEEDDNEDHYSSFDLGIVSLPHLMRAEEGDDIDIIEKKPLQEPYEHAITDELSPVSASSLSDFEEYVQADASPVNQRVIVAEEVHRTNELHSHSHVSSINCTTPEQEQPEQQAQSDLAVKSWGRNERETWRSSLVSAAASESTSVNSTPPHFPSSLSGSTYIHFREFEADHDGKSITPTYGTASSQPSFDNGSGNATRMSISELERYRTSISELMQEYEARESNMNRQHGRGHGQLRSFSSTSSSICEELTDPRLLRLLASSQLGNDEAFHGSLQSQPEEEPWYAEEDHEAFAN